MINKDKIKGFLVGLIASVLAISATAFAESIEKTITAVYNNIKIVVNGETITPKDVNGNVVEPFIINGTTYLPVRAVSEALGEDVSWDGENNTVYIGSKPASTTPDVADTFAVDNDSLAKYKDATIAKINSNEISGGMVNFFLNQSDVSATINNSGLYKKGDTLQSIIIEDKSAAKYFTDSVLESIAITLNSAELAEKSGLNKAEESKAAIKALEDQFFSQFESDKAYNDFLAEFSTTDSAIKELVYKSALSNIYLKNLQTSLMNTSDDILYKEYLKNYVHVKHILVKDKDTAHKIIAQLKSGADFTSLMKEHSTDPGQSDDGYIFTKGEMVAPFENAAFSMKDNTYSDKPVETDYGYHILYKYTLTKDDFNKSIDKIRQSYVYSEYYNQIEELGKLYPITYTDKYKDYITNIK